VIERAEQLADVGFIGQSPANLEAFGVRRAEFSIFYVWQKPRAGNVATGLCLLSRGATDNLKPNRPQRLRDALQGFDGLRLKAKLK